jgi:hypothetical protein
MSQWRKSFTGGLAGVDIILLEGEVSQQQDDGDRLHLEKYQHENRLGLNVYDTCEAKLQTSSKRYAQKRNAI